MLSAWQRLLMSAVSREDGSMPRIKVVCHAFSAWSIAKAKIRSNPKGNLPLGAGGSYRLHRRPLWPIRPGEIRLLAGLSRKFPGVRCMRCTACLSENADRSMAPYPSSTTSSSKSSCLPRYLLTTDTSFQDGRSIVRMAVFCPGLC